MSELILGGAFGNLEPDKLVVSTVLGLVVVAVLIFLAVKQLEQKEQ